MRVHILAKQLGVSSKAILEKCRAEGLDVPNHMSRLTAGLDATIREWFSEGAHVIAVETTQRVDLKKVRVQRRKKAPKKPAAEAKEEPVAAEVPTTAVAEVPPAEARPAEVEVPAAAAPPAAPVEVPAAEPAVVTAEPPESVEITLPMEAPIAAPAVAAEAPPLAPAAQAPAEAPAAEAFPQEVPEPPPEPEPIMPAGPQNIPGPARLQGPRIVRVEAPEAARVRPTGLRPGGLRPTTEMAPLAPLPPKEITGRRKARGRVAPVTADDEALARQRKARSTSRSPRRTGRGSDSGLPETLHEWRDQDLLEREERLRQASGRGIHARRAHEGRPGGPRPISTERKRKVQVEEPINMREFCEATGLSFQQLAGKLVREHRILPNIAMTLNPDLAELLALDFGVELEVIKAKSALDRLQEAFEQLEHLRLERRPPVVTILGHVDHGKTSILDRIRQARVVEGEAGGITQHIGAYRFDKDGVHVTFLDTPGHEAFTAMRARGANMTDIVVLVVAADDGVMPQTVESINHAKAAGVPIVVALNKIDLQGIDVNRVYGQLSEHGLVPVEWGGDTEVVRTSAVTGEGLDALLEYLSTFSELLDLKADPECPARGTVIEAEMKEGVGPAAHVLVREGSLKAGNVIVCGPAFGRVRVMSDDRGKRLRQATPGTPVEVAGLDEVPNAGDPFYVVQSLTQAKETAEEVRDRRRKESLLRFTKPKDIVTLLQQRDEEEIPTLHLILRTDTHGSADALQNALSELPSDQVKLSILQASVGGITEGDVLLAQASDAVIIGFYVVADSKASLLAAQTGVDIRLYQVIYQVIDDIRQALEGMLAPETRLEVRGKAEVRDIFHISRVGTVAGCYVTDGIMGRNHKVRVIRENIVVFPREEGRHAGLASLRRFKDDVREARAGLECGMKIEGFDDVKPGDQIEAYEIVKVPGKL